MVKKIYGVDLTFNNIPLDDQKTWNLIGNGQTLGVFQFASQLAISVVTKIKPQNIEELSAANAFIRPGASGLDEYNIAKKDPSKRIKLHPNLDTTLEPTYGSIVYQEQIMSLIASVQGIDFGEADEYRRMLEKAGKWPDKVAAWKKEFIAAGLSNGYDKKLIDLLVQLIIDNSGYGFNKSHAVSYSIISYWTAYMKANYPLVFYTAMLNGNLDDADLFMAEARKLNIQILPPHVNHSRMLFSIEGNGIRAGFNAIKGVGPKAVQSIISTQPYQSIDNYFGKNEKAAINKGVVTALIKAGAFSDMGIAIGEDDIPSELDDKFKYDVVDGVKNIFLTREQMELWNDYVNEGNAKKTVKNYLVPPEMVKGKYFDKYELVEEKDGGIVVPEDRLADLDLKLKDLPSQDSTRKKPKGSFDKALDPMKDVSAFRKPFILYHNEISKVSLSYLDKYLKESVELGFSFLPHPLEKNIDKIDIYDEIEDDHMMTTAGIITSIVERKTKRGNPFYWVTVKSPRDSVRITLWDNQMQAYKDYIKKYNLIVVRGQKGFGGIGCDQLKLINFKNQ